MTLRSIPCALLCLLLAALPAPLAAQNLLTNPDVTANLGGWDSGPDTGHNAAEGSPPGSAEWRHTVTGESEIEDLVFLRQCVDGIVPGTTYSFSGLFALVQVPSGSSGNIVIAWNAGAGCGDLLGVFHAASPVTTTAEGWHPSTGSAVAPIGAGSAEFSVVGGVAAFGPGTITEQDVSLVEGEHLVGADTFFFGPEQEVPTMGVLWIVALGLVLLLVASRRLRASPRPAA